MVLSGLRRTPALKRVVCWTTAGTLFAVLVVTVISHLNDVHRHYGVWSWSPGPATPRIEFRGRTYTRGPTQAQLSAPAGYTAAATAPGRGIILAPPSPDGLAATVLVVDYPDGSSIEYALSGGP